MTTETPILNEHNKTEYPPMHNGEFNTSPIAIYTSEDNTISLDVKLENETVWLSRSQLSILFDRDIKTIGKHINNALKEELEGLPVVAKNATAYVNKYHLCKNCTGSKMELYLLSE